MLNNFKRILRENEEKKITDNLTAKPDSMEDAAETVIGDDIKVDGSDEIVNSMVDNLPVTEPGEEPIDAESLVENVAKSYVSKF